MSGRRQGFRICVPGPGGTVRAVAVADLTRGTKAISLERDDTRVTVFLDPPEAAAVAAALLKPPVESKP